MPEFVSLIFCRRCGSRHVEVNQWDDEEAIFHCRSCNNKETLRGFTLGRCEVSGGELQRARDTIPSKDEYEK